MTSHSTPMRRSKRGHKRSSAEDSTLTPECDSPVLRSKRRSRPSGVDAEAQSHQALLSQDDSFFESILNEMESFTPQKPKSTNVTQGSQDLFAFSDDEVVTPVANGHKSSMRESNTSVVSGESQNLEEMETQPPPISMSASSLPSSLPPSMPPSILNVRERAIADEDESQDLSGVESAAPAVSPQTDNLFPSEHLTKSERDKGPFFGLPDRVRHMYKDLKGITELFPWQCACLMSESVQEKRNLLYSLPTSGGKTLVAEIIMLQELLCYRKNVIFVVPYVSLVQEKIRSLAPFALELGFYLEEYAGSKGRFPPVKRRFKTSLFVCTIEKSHTLFNSLVQENRVNEIGLVVIDEVHMLGEEPRGAHLETLVTKIKFLNKRKNEKIQLISMSATVGNLRELSKFMDSELFTDSWRPVKLEEYVKLTTDVYRLNSLLDRGEEFSLDRKLDVMDYTAKMKQVDEDYLTKLVMEVFPTHSCLVFCDTKRRCENVADMLAKMIIGLPNAESVYNHRKQEKASLKEALKIETSGFLCPVMNKTLPFGITYHHSGLTAEERKLIEEAFLSGTLGVLCCTSTLAAGVNLPARRVIIRSPFMGRRQLTHTQYKQMVGRAGRAGLDTHGESFLMVKQNQINLVQDIVTAPVEHCVSCLHKADSSGLSSLILNSIFLGLVSTPEEIKELIDLTLLFMQSKKLGIKVAVELESCFMFLLNAGLVTSGSEATQQQIEDKTKLFPTRLGRACVQGSIDLRLAKRLYQDLADARPCLAVDTSLHLLFLVTPYDMAESVYYTAQGYHQVYMKLSSTEVSVAKNVGIKESTIVGMMVGRSAPKSLQPVLARFYLALVLFDLWHGSSIHEVAGKFELPRGDIQNLMNSAASFAVCVLHFCQEFEEFWAYQELLDPFAKRLAHCCSPELLTLMELPGVRAGRARQLANAGFSSLAAIAKTDYKTLSRAVPHISHKTAQLLIQAAKLNLVEKAETLRDEADEVLANLKVNW